MALTVEIDPAELEFLAAQLELDKKAMVSAAKSAANKAVRWARVQAARGLSSRLGIPQGAFKSRVKARTGKKSSVWIALNQLNVLKAGAKKTSRGLRAGREEFLGAFETKGKFGGTAGLRRKGKARTPLESASFDVAQAGTPLINSEVWPGLNERFLNFYKSELARKAGL